MRSLNVHFQTSCSSSQKSSSLSNYLQDCVAGTFQQDWWKKPSSSFPEQSLDSPSLHICPHMASDMFSAYKIQAEQVGGGGGGGGEET